MDPIGAAYVKISQKIWITYFSLAPSPPTSRIIHSHISLQPSYGGVKPLGRFGPIGGHQHPRRKQGTSPSSLAGKFG